MVTTTLRQAVRPAPSDARIVIVLEPVSSGIAALHCVVPEAAPDLPVLVDQITAATPLASVAVPRNTIEEDDVARVLEDGEAIVSVGGAAFGAAGAGAGAGAGTGPGMLPEGSAPGCAAAYNVCAAAISPDDSEDAVL